MDQLRERVAAEVRVWQLRAGGAIRVAADAIGILMVVYGALLLFQPFAGGRLDTSGALTGLPLNPVGLSPADGILVLFGGLIFYLVSSKLL
jgi:hypothetical protein